MAIDDVNVVDAIATDKKNGALILMLTDHFEWENEYLKEADHLIMLQDKINSYLSYIEGEQYKEIYPDIDFKMSVIEIHFKYDIPENCRKFLKVVQDQISKFSINIDVRIG